MNLFLLNLPATTPAVLDGTAPAALPGNDGGMPVPVNPFAQLLDTAVQDEIALTADLLALPLPDEASSVTGLTPDHPEQQPDEDPAPDLPWPPDGLASLWLPAAPEPVQADAAPTPVADGISLETRTSPVATTDDSRNISEPTPLPQETNPLSLRERGRGEGATEAAEPFAAIKNISSESTVTSTEPTPLPQETNPLSLRERGRGEGATEAAEPFASSKNISSEPATAPTPPTPTFAIASAPSAHAPVQTPAPASTTTTAPFPAPELHADTFPDTLGTHIHWLADHKINHAHIQLNPQDMGPVEVRLKLDGDQLQADFSSTQPEVRHALEQGLPRLRELLGEHGLNLAQADIGQQPSQRHSVPSTHADDAPSASDEHTDTAPVPSTPVTITHSNGLIDAYA